ncbi:transglutaminase-like cysteine peptidase [Pseudomonas sp. JS3066]|uniref:transglutaminase-like cysteine peptidase n=1 Tax=unclassified Pseudomonas TaxID=196821 RepID=UPI002E7AF1AC|nr:transglutaminase-like cysteine peptidase [Pseudomonas sp. JS3066]WVK91819.1 transglutaminase-like cysteine peptidase [Pseudomonas sp. JS3066]
MQKPAPRRFGVPLSWQLLTLAVFSGALLLGAGDARAAWSVDPVLRKAEKRFGRSGPAKDRLHAWRDLLETGHRLTERQQLEAVNRQINRQVRFTDDSALWQRRDYWATPVETLAKGAGDCEDFALAKYFTLLQLGVDPSKLRITYARALELNQAHMVVTYYETPDAEPLVLDNLVDDILTSSRRKDLALRYAFDADGLYAMKGGALRRVGNTAELPFWQGLLARMERDGFAL